MSSKDSNRDLTFKKVFRSGDGDSSTLPHSIAHESMGLLHQKIHPVICLHINDNGEMIVTTIKGRRQNSLPLTTSFSQNVTEPSEAVNYPVDNLC